MDYKPIFESVGIGDIDLENERFKISTDGPSEAMVASIKLAGVLSPPIVYQRQAATSSYTIVSGFKRLNASRIVGLKKVVVKILLPDVPQEHLVRIAIIENTLQRDLNFVEQARVIRLLDQLHTDQASLCKDANRFGLSVNVTMLKKLRAIANMPSVLQCALIHGDVALPVAMQLAEMEDRETANQLTAIFGDIGLGLNRQRELLEWLVSISRRDTISINALLEEDDIKRDINDADMDRGEKSRRLRRYFKRRRYPEITETENRFRRAVHALKLEQGIQLIAPPHFEGQTYSLKIDFKRHQDLITRYRNLESVVTSPAWASLLDPTTSE